MIRSLHHGTNFFRRRPISSFLATASAASFGYASYLEWNADRKCDKNALHHYSQLHPQNPKLNPVHDLHPHLHHEVELKNSSQNSIDEIPRSHYDPVSIAQYWEQRPISVMKRLVNIALELGPVAGEYLSEFHLKPWFEGMIGSNKMTIDVQENGNSNAKCEAMLSQAGTASTIAAEMSTNNAGEIPNQEHRSKSQLKQTLERELAQKLRSALTTLGPTFVKVGQQLSIRPDLVSPIVLYELQRLCDAVPPFDDEVAMRVLAEELLLSMDADNIERGQYLVTEEMKTEEDVHGIILKVFAEMPKLVASASLGQVYKATLKSNENEISNADETNSAARKTSSNNQQVAIKIQRPDILETVTLDLFLLVTYGKVVDKLFSVLTNQLPYHEPFLNGFARGAFMELNYCHEAENQMYFREELQSRFRQRSVSWSNNTLGANGDGKVSSKVRPQRENNTFYGKFGSLLPFFRNRKTNPNETESVIVPKVFKQYTTERILVSDWIDGIPLAQAPPEQIRELIPVGVELFLCQLLDMGRFHADPHPGNLYVTTSKTDGITPTLCLLDFGLIANVDEKERNSMTHAILHLLQGDYDALIAHDAKNLGFLPQDMDVTELTPLLKTILKQGLVESGSNLHDRRRNLMAISKELNEVFFRYPFSVPPFFALVTRGLGLLEGIALSGDPSFDIFKASYPYAKRRAMETFSMSDYGKISRNMLSLHLQNS